MRRASVLFMTAAIVLSIVTPALAKSGEFGLDVSESAAISGPGLSGPVGLDGAALSTYSDLSNLFSPTSRMHIRPSSVALGPRFDVLFTMACPSASGYDTLSIQQQLYPYASFNGQPQVWTLTSAAQRTCSEFVRVAPGWSATRPGLFDTLTAAGLPRTAPAHAPIPGPGRLPVPQADRFWPVFGLTAALMMLLLVAALIGRPRRRARALS